MAKLPPAGTSFFAGIDENGLGPVLGPMVVTGVLARAADDRAAQMIEKKPPRGMRTRLADSKELVAHDDDALGEAWARVLAATTTASSTPTEDLIASLMLDHETSFLARCPSHHDDHCWGDRGNPLGAPADLVDAVAGDVAKLSAKGITIVGVKSVVLCNNMMNEATARGVSRFVQDLHAMERLVVHFRETAGERVSFTCGKVGGFDFYDGVFGPLAGELRTTLLESRRLSAYEMPGVGRVSFVMDADASHLLVSMASLVGKWLRDVLMRKIVAFYKNVDASLPDVSGYHDPVTRGFIAKTALLRKHRAVADACFLREKVSAPLQTGQSPSARAAASAASAARSKRSNPTSPVQRLLPREEP